MEVRFAKWHGTGNDFILVDDREGSFPDADIEVVRRLCDRHFGIGSDGLILLQLPREPGADFHMEFFNPDGSKSFCGNGSRCAFAFWSRLTGGSNACFSAVDGLHQGAWSAEQVVVTLGAVGAVQRTSMGTVDFLHNGSPHELVWVPEPDAVDIMTEGAARRYAPMRAASGGTNVNFVKATADGIAMRTYERGVEAETLSCGTGVVAAALSALERGVAKVPVTVHTRGGTLTVEAERGAAGGYLGIRLIGPVAMVFEGTAYIKA